MNDFLRSWKRLATGAATAALAVLLAPAAVAQCPIPASCVPGRASNPSAGAFGMGIFNVSLGTAANPTAGFSNATAGQADGYVDYGCATPAVGATLLVGQSYQLRVNTNTLVGESVRAWIDYNNDGLFIGTNELVMTSNNATTHLASFVPPSSAVFNTPLRMRVSADYALVTAPTSCSTPQYSQVEDYAVTIVANANPPVAAFTPSAGITCTGCVQFADASQNVPTSWLWNFGDNTTSTQQNPNHCYTAPGTYTVTLTVTNAAGTSPAATGTVTYNSQVPVAAACTPPTLGYCCNYGVTRLRLGTIDNTSLDGRAGYQDFTCAQRTDLILGDVHPINITLGNTSTNQDTRVYLDGNNDGIFTTAELVFQALAPNAPVGVLNLPGTVQTNVALRLRVVSDAGGNNPQPCTSPVSGQIEDYTVVVRPNTNPPTAAFTSNYVPGGCVNPIQFTDQSTGAPTSWLWDFGDGNTSTLQNPTHSYAATGTYTVTLTATNAIGPNTVTRTNYLSVTVPCLIYCRSNGVGANMGGGNFQPSPFWIASVSVANAQPAFSYNGGTTPNSVGGYGNHTGLPISVAAGGPVNLSVVSNLNFAHRTTVWVDFNRDGVFALSELVSNGITPAGPGASTYNDTFQLPATQGGQSLRMRIQCLLSNSAPNACAINIQNAEVEDYTLVVRPLGVRGAQLLPTLSLYPNPTPDGRLRLHLPDATGAGSYVVSVENLLGARQLQATLRLGPAADAELDLSGLAKGVYVLRLRDAQGRTALRRVVRE